MSKNVPSALAENTYKLTIAVGITVADEILM